MLNYFPVRNMWKTFPPIYLFLCILLFVVIAESSAHSGHSKSEAKQQKTENPNLIKDTIDMGDFYAIEDEEIGSQSAPFSRTDFFSSDTLEQGEMVIKPKDHEEMNQAKHQVKLSHHELISPSQKGFKSALVITLIVGVLFGILSFRRRRD